MDREQLIAALKNFRLACVEIDCIRDDNLFAFDFEEVYQGVFIININIKEEWLNKKYDENALEELIKLLYQNTTSKTRESILTLRLCKENSVDTLQTKETA